MPHNLLNRGRYGEEKAANYLIEKGYSLLKRNYTARWAEIDLIAEKDDTIVFVEVKTRRTTAKGKPYEAFTPGKQARVLRSAQLFLTKNKLHNKRVRLDVISILLEPFQLDHFENVTM